MSPKTTLLTKDQSTIAVAEIVHRQKQKQFGTAASMIYCYNISVSISSRVAVFPCSNKQFYEIVKYNS